ncbi:hypothetical protein KP509_03G078900 [Ceratopteris richardii]|uniref:Uncharacterized protein n=1 Tax=Ceratopteris richardii TaxID=49495 RepID=A0A8T2V8L4_CERRI|nr:hypothetical protein KP509_03G078900 [Ceratopteris richardii]
MAELKVLTKFIHPFRQQHAQGQPTMASSRHNQCLQCATAASSNRKPVSGDLPGALQRITISTFGTSIQRLLDCRSNGDILSTACNILEYGLRGILLSPGSLKPSNDPALLLTGNYAPVPECPPQPCVVANGALPADLNGIYIRNGPNPLHIFQHEGYHMFDGDGMLHAVLLRNGIASYCCRYVRTSRLEQEELAGRPLFVKFFGGLRGPQGLARTIVFLVRATLGVINISEGWGLSNTSVTYFNGRVLSLSEDDMPYVIKVDEDGDLLTRGRLQFSHFKPSWNMCAHPKIDPSTGEMYAFTFRPSLRHPFSFFKVSVNGVKSREVTIPLSSIPFMHDFAITENFVIFPDNQFVIRPLMLLRGETPLIFDKMKPSRICVMRRDATTQEDMDKPLWFNVDGCNAYHYLNAWEEGDEVVLITPILSSPECFLDFPEYQMSSELSMIRLNLIHGSSSIRRLCRENLEFGTFNQNYTGRKMRFAYFAIGFYPHITGVAKVDLHAQEETDDKCIVARRDFGRNCHGNEPFFVPKTKLHDVTLSHTDASNKTVGGMKECTAEEDEGYVLCLVHDQSKGISSLVIMDAQSPSLEPIASIELPSRVPYGFHGFFVNEEQLGSEAF